MTYLPSWIKALVRRVNVSSLRGLKPLRIWVHLVKRCSRKEDRALVPPQLAARLPDQHRWEVLPREHMGQAAETGRGAREQMGQAAEIERGVRELLRLQWEVTDREALASRGERSRKKRDLPLPFRWSNVSPRWGVTRTNRGLLIRATPSPSRLRALGPAATSRARKQTRLGSPPTVGPPWSLRMVEPATSGSPPAVVPPASLRREELVTPGRYPASRLQTNASVPGLSWPSHFKKALKLQIHFNYSHKKLIFFSSRRSDYAPGFWPSAFS